MFLEHGFVFTHEALHDWEARFAPLLADQLRTKRRGQAGTSWYVDETSLKVHGKWCYLYRASDVDGNLVESRRSEKREMDAAQQCFNRALAVVGQTPERVTTDGQASSPRAVRKTLGTMCSIEPTNPSPIAWCKTIGESSNGIPHARFQKRWLGCLFLLRF
jgi:putative transposase